MKEYLLTTLLHKEYQEQLRQADKENAKLSIQIEQLQKHIEELSNKINDSKKESDLQ